MARSALITGGTGGLGSAVTRAFLDAGWRVVVPLHDESERGNVEAHERLVLEPADLLHLASTAAVAQLAAGEDARRWARWSTSSAASPWASACTRCR